MPRFTIIINTIRRDRELVEKSLKQALSQGGDSAVLLVDQNPEPLDLPTDILSQPNFTRQNEVVSSVSRARNLARYPIETEWIIFCDDDGYLENGYLGRLKSLIQEKPGMEVFAGAIRRIDTGDFYSKRHALGGDLRRFWNLKLLMGSNFCVKREVFERLGKFDEDFGAGARFGSSEETDFAWNAHFHGAKMMFAPELVVFHVPPFAGAPELEIQKAKRYGYGKGAMVRKWLGRGKLLPLLELMEMIIVPAVLSAGFLFTGRIYATRLRFAAIAGRIKGLFLA